MVVFIGLIRVTLGFCSRQILACIFLFAYRMSMKKDGAKKSGIIINNRQSLLYLQRNHHVG
jgi:hypothetical protein